jgi:hypothetical protein
LDAPTECAASVIDEDQWPYSERIYIIGTIEKNELIIKLEILQPTEVEEENSLNKVRRVNLTYRIIIRRFIVFGGIEFVNLHLGSIEVASQIDRLPFPR